MTTPMRYSGSQLSPGTLTAHERFHLVLLCSHPDTVHRFPLRKTRTSTPLTEGSHESGYPLPAITLPKADLEYKAPLLPRLYGFSSIIVLQFFVKSHRIKNTIRLIW